MAELIMTDDTVKEEMNYVAFVNNKVSLLIPETAKIKDNVVILTAEEAFRLAVNVLLQLRLSVPD